MKSVIKKIVLVFIFYIFSSNAFAELPTTRDLIVETKNGAVHHFIIDLAVTPVEQQIGLMHRKSLPENYGMLFVFEGEAERSFWMKNTYIPLDVIFIKKDGTIHHIHENAKPHDLTTFTSQGPVMAALEVIGGTSKKLGIKKGDTVRHFIFSNMQQK